MLIVGKETDFMRKRIFLFIILILALIFASCSNNSSQGPKENLASDTSIENSADNSTGEVLEEENDVEEETDGPSVSVSLGETGENLSLPNRYPKDVIPLLDDANIINVNDNDDAKALGIIFKTDKSFEEAIEFYNETMKEGTITVQTEKDDSYFIMGAKGDLGVIITISKYEGDKISILINITF